jgi:uncharacterized protein (DUF58 family)
MGCSNAGRSKLHYAASLAGALAHLAIKQRDAVGLTLFADTVIAHLPPRSKANQLEEVLATIATATPRASESTEKALNQSAALCRRRGLVVVISDVFGDLEETIGGLDHLRFLNHEVILFHLMDPVERDLSLDGNIRFRDLESGETLTTQAEGIRDAYKKAVDAWRQALELECRKRAIDRIELVTTDPPDRAILDYLVKRAKTF